MPIPAALALGLIPPLIKAGAGLSQTIKANKLAKHERPIMSTTPADQEALAMSRMLAYDSGLPGQSMIENKLQGSTAAGTRAIRETARDSSELINSAIGMYGAEMGAMNDIAIAGAGSQQARLDQLRAQLNRMGGIQQEQFNFNQVQPYEKDMNASSALRGAGAQNLFGALNDATSFAMMMKMNPDVFGKGGGAGAGSGDGSGAGIGMNALEMGQPGQQMNLPMIQQYGQRNAGINIPAATNNQMPYNTVVGGGNIPTNQEELLAWIKSIINQ